MSSTPLPRIGLGIDSHRLVAGRACWLGGLLIPCDRGPEGHSDGDAILHAACDAVLGAAGLDDLGTLFRDSDPRWKGADSALFCAEVMRQLQPHGLRVLSLDVVVETEVPRIGPHRAAMRARLGELFQLPVDRVNVKGKSGEQMGDIGTGRLLRATVVALLA